VKIYLQSLVIGFDVGIIYYAVKVKSPPPPLFALVGLLGMVLGEQAIPFVHDHLWPVIQHWVGRG
jgi:XapX domain-containing protein